MSLVLHEHRRDLRLAAELQPVHRIERLGDGGACREQAMIAQDQGVVVAEIPAQRRARGGVEHHAVESP